jgi:hypothetical protein
MNAINGAVSVWGGGMFHATVMHAGRYQEMPASSGYKSQRINRTKEEDRGGKPEKKNRRGGTTERKVRGEGTKEIGNRGKYKRKSFKKTKQGRTRRPQQKSKGRETNGEAENTDSRGGQHHHRFPFSRTSQQHRAAQSLPIAIFPAESRTPHALLPPPTELCSPSPQTHDLSSGRRPNSSSQQPLHLLQPAEPPPNIPFSSGSSPNIADPTKPADREPRHCFSVIRPQMP